MARKNDKLPKGKSRSKKFTSRKKGKVNGTDDTISRNGTTDASNDPSWYTGDSTLTFDAGRFNFMVPNGTIIDTLPKPFTFAGVHSIRLVHGIGVTSGPNSVVNVAARLLYTKIRESKSSYATYDPADLMQYCIAIAEAYAYHNWMIRIYGILNVYSQLNRYMPEALLTANCVSSNDLLEHIPDLLFYINKFGSQISTFAIPNTLPYFQRLAWLYSNVYTDDMTGKSTLYMYVPAGFRTFNHSTATLEFNRIDYSHYEQSNMLKLSDIITLGDSIVNNLLECQDFWNMSADILNYYGSDKLLKVMGVPVDYAVYPTFNLEVLSQIQNLFVVGCKNNTSESPDYYSYDITQDNSGSLIFEPHFSLVNNMNTVMANSGPRRCALSVIDKGKHLINMYKDQVTPADVFVATRLRPTLTRVENSDPSLADYMRITSMGTEFAEMCTIYYFYVNDSNDRVLSRNNYLSVQPYWATGDENVNVLNGTLNAIRLLSNISYHPHMITGQIDNPASDNPTWAQSYDVGDVANFTIMNNDDLAKLHTTALYSLFSVPTLGTGIN